MAKLLLLITFIVFVYLRFIRKNRQPPGVQPPHTPASEGMVPCAYCGVYLPQSEAIANDRASGTCEFYCCTAHRQLGVKE
ncbi:MAG TPA: PP0621 family protein [Rugosibacter sp.]